MKSDISLNGISNLVKNFLKFRITLMKFFQFIDAFCFYNNKNIKRSTYLIKEFSSL